MDPTPAPPAPALRIGIGALAGALLLAVTAQLFVLPWLLKFALIVLVALTIPTARHLSGRVLVLAAGFLGTSLPLWLIPVGAFGLTHGTLLAGAVGGLAGGFAARSWPGDGVRGLVPELRWIDALPLLAAGATAFYFRRPLLTGDIGNALSMTVVRWDNSSHVYLASLLHDTGRLQPFLGASFDGSGWGFADYPTGYHSAVATLLDLISRPGATRSSELLSFWHAVALVLIVIVTGCVAAVTATPRARTRPLVALVVGAAVVSTFLFGPGFHAVADGHQNVPIALFGAAAVMSSMLSARTVWQPVHVGVAVAGVVTAIGAWAPIGALAGLGCLALVLPLAKSRWSAPRRAIVACVSLVAAGLVAVGLIYRWATSGVGGNFLVSANGGVSPVDGGLFFAVVVGVALATVAAAITAWIGSPRDAEAMRLAVLGLVPLAAFGAYLVLANQQFKAFGELRYYSIKLGAVACVIGLLYLAFAALYLAPRLDPQRAGRPLVRVLTAALLAVSTVAMYGSVLATPYLSGGQAPGRAAQDVLASQGERDILTALMTAADKVPADNHAIVMSQAFGPLNCARYTVALLSIKGTYTQTGSDLVNALIGDADMASAAAKLLAANPHVWVITDAATKSQLGTSLAPDLAGRVVAYDA